MEAPNFPTRPVGCTQLPNLDSGTCFFSRENLGAADFYGNRSFVKIWFRNEFVPIYFHDTFFRIVSSRHKSYLISKLVDSKSTEPFFAQRQALMSCCPLIRQSLLVAIIITGSQPDRPKYIKRHAFAIIGDSNCRFG